MAVDLDEDERQLLFYGLVDWGGPARCTEAVARAMGFDGLTDLRLEGHRIAEAISQGQPVSLRDWTRALFSTELIFGSDLVGTGIEWTTIHGGTDGHWLELVRGLRIKLPVSPAQLPA